MWEGMPAPSDDCSSFGLTAPCSKCILSEVAQGGNGRTLNPKRGTLFILCMNDRGFQAILGVENTTGHAQELE
jgi:hypothetical protein